jgi:hypothetical protein
LDHLYSWIAGLHPLRISLQALLAKLGPGKLSITLAFMAQEPIKMGNGDETVASSIS